MINCDSDRLLDGLCPRWLIMLSPVLSDVGRLHHSEVCVCVCTSATPFMVRP